MHCNDYSILQQSICLGPDYTDTLPMAVPEPSEVPKATEQVLMRAVPLELHEEQEEEEEEEEVDECVDPTNMSKVVMHEECDEDVGDEDETKGPGEECDEDETKNPGEGSGEDETKDHAEECVEDESKEAMAATPGKETVHYDQDAVLPACPAGGDDDETPAMSPAEQMKLSKPKGCGRGRGRGGKGQGSRGGRGRGRGRSGRGRAGGSSSGKGRSNGHEADEAAGSKGDDRCDGEITPTEKEATDDETVHVKSHERSRPKRSRSCSESEHHHKKAKAEQRKRKRAPSPSPEAKPRTTKPKAKAKPTAASKAKAKAQSKAKAKPSSKAVAKPTHKAAAKATPKAKAKPGPKAKVTAKAAKARHDEGDVIAERKARLSRKSAAYHKAVKQGKDSGKSAEECKALGKEAALCALVHACVC